MSQADDIDPQKAVARKKGHNPRSPEDDARGGDLYMRLPQHRLRKFRETIYADPGNPFGFEEFEDSLLPTTANADKTRRETDSSTTWPFTDPKITQTSCRAEREINSVFSDPFDLANPHSDRGTWSSFGSNRRSMSVDIGFLPMQSILDHRRSSDTEPHWPLNVPTLHVQHPSGTVFTTNRDSRFYDFYDDLLADYEAKEISDGIHQAHVMLPIVL
jgi:hypothetical protein